MKLSSAHKLVILGAKERVLFRLNINRYHSFIVSVYESKA